MNKILVIANWKMKLKRTESVELAQKYNEALAQYTKKYELVICPSFVALGDVVKISKLSLGAQNMSWQMEGALTGEISPIDLLEIGCKYVLLGHSERRLFLGETDIMVANKVKIALDIGLIPIVCVGETWEELSEGKRDIRLMQQLRAIFQNIVLSENRRVVIAYEPIWAIGSGKNIDPKDAFSAALLIRHTLRDFFHEDALLNQFSFIYGGSVSAKNAHEYFAPDSLRGVLVGGASLELESFLGIIENIAKYV